MITSDYQTSETEFSMKLEFLWNHMITEGLLIIIKLPYPQVGFSNSFDNVSGHFEDF